LLLAALRIGEDSGRIASADPNGRLIFSTDR